MTILFTKKVDPLVLSETLNKNFQTDFLELIDFGFKSILPFNLEGKSLIFTSANGVEGFFKNNFRPENGLNKIYCVGSKTKLEVEKFGFQVFETCDNEERLSDFIVKNSNYESFLHFCGNLSLDILANKLSSENVNYRKIILYETNLLYPKTEKKYDALVFFSPSGVRSFAKNNSLENSTLFSIGETTSAEIKKLTKQDIITSKEQTLKSLLILINTKFKADIA